MQDISSATGGWTHTDTGNKIDETTYRVRWNALTNDESSYHYKGGYSISGNFTHYFASSFDTATEVVYVGRNTTGASGYGVANMALLADYTTPDRNETVYGLWVNCLTTGNVKVAIHNSAGTSIIAKQDTSTAVVAGWNYIAFESSVTLSASTTYLLGIIQDTESLVSYQTDSDTSNLRSGVTYSNGWVTDVSSYAATNVKIDVYASTRSVVAIWGVGDFVGDAYTSYVNSTDNHGLFLLASDTGKVLTLTLYERDGATGRTVATQALPESYRYHTLFYKVNRTGNAWTVKIYKEPSLTTLLYTLTASPTLNSVQTYTTIFMGNSYNTGVTSTISGYVGNLYLNETPVSIFKPVVISKPIYPDDAETNNEDFPTGDKTWTLTGTTTTVTSKPAASADDTVFRWTGSAWGISATNTVNYIGYHTATSLKHGSGQRFPSLQVPKRATVTASKITFTSKTNASATTVTGVIIGEKSSDATQFSTTEDYQSRRGTVVGGANDNNVTTASVAWTNIGAWTAESTYDTPDIKTILQEQVNQTTWEKGNALGIFIDDHAGVSSASNDTERQSYSYDADPTKVPVLSVTYRGESIVPSNEWSHSGTYSIKITGVDGVSDSGAYFTRSVSTFKSGVVDAYFKLTELGENQASQLFGLADSGSNAIVGYVEDVSGVKYFRIGLFYASAWHWSTATNIVCELNTEYHITLVYYNRYYRASVFVNNQLADYMDFPSTVTPNRIHIGAVSNTAKFGGTRYIDSIRYQNGNNLFPSIARGGANKQTLVWSELLTDLHSSPQNGQFSRVWKSTDNGATWTYLFGEMVEWEHTGLGIRWNPTTSTFWAFGNKRISYDSGTTWLAESVIYEIEDFDTTPTLTLRKNYGRQAVTGASKYTADNTTFTTDTTAANNATTGDMAIFDGTVEDAYYIGKADKFDTVELDISQAAVGTFTVVKEYWDGDSWEALTATDDSILDFTTAGDKKLFRFRMPSDWATTSLSDSLPSTSYWIRFRVSAFTSMATLPLGTQAFLTMSGWLFPTREITDGKLYMGIAYYPATGTRTSSYVTSAKYDFDNNVITDEYLITVSTSLSAEYDTVGEPILWHDTSGNLHAMMRFDDSSESYATSPESKLNERYKTSADDGMSNWNGDLLHPGVDWNQTGGLMRAFMFQGYAYLQLRMSRGQAYPGGALGLRDYDPLIVRKTVDTPDGDGKINVIAEALFPGLSELSNGDIDGMTGGSTASYLDLGTNIAGTGFYYRLQLNDWVPSNDVNFGSDF